MSAEERQKMMEKMAYTHYAIALILVKEGGMDYEKAASTARQVARKLGIELDVEFTKPFVEETDEGKKLRKWYQEPR